MYDVIALGELLVDLAERSKDEVGYPTLAANPGGAPGNFLAALSAYGKKTAFLAKVGDDTFGRLLAGTMQRAGIDGCGIRIDPDTFTTLAFVTFDAHGDRSFAFARKPGADTQLRWDEIDPAMLDETHVFHFGSLSCTDEPARSATQSAVAYARAHGKLVTYDPNYRPPLWKTEQEAKEQILWGLRQADLVKISDEEVQFLWGCSPEQGAERVLALGAKLVMVTLGPKGCFLKNAQAEYRCGCPQVRTVDTTGAGDIFGGSAVSRFLELGKTPEQLTQELADCRPEMIYLPVEWLDTLDVTPYLDRTSFCAVLPRIFRTEDEAVLREMLVRHRQVLAAVAVGNLGHLPIAEGLELPLRGDLGMNVFNSRALLFLRELGLSTAAVSFELRHQQIRDLKKYLPCEAVVYGRLPLMLMENCVIANSLGCCDVGSDYRKRSSACRCTGENVLTDRTGARFPLMPAWGHRNELENSRTLFLADKPEWRRLGLTYARLRFTTESPAECVAALQRYQGQGDYIPADLTRGLFYRGVE